MPQPQGDYVTPQGLVSCFRPALRRCMVHAERQSLGSHRHDLRIAPTHMPVMHMAGCLCRQQGRLAGQPEASTVPGAEAACARAAAQGHDWYGSPAGHSATRRTGALRAN